MLYTVTFGFLASLLCDPSWASNSLINVNLKHGNHDVDATFIGNALSYLHCFMMCSKFVGEGCESIIFEEDECLVPIALEDSSYWILTTYGYSIENDIRQANQEAELIQINPANEDDKAQHCHLGHYPELRTAHASGGFVDDQLLVCGGSRSDMDPMKSSHPLCFVLGNSRVMAYSEFPRGMAASLPISDYLWITGGWNSLTQEITKSTERIILGAKSESGPDLPFPLAGHCLFQLNKTMALLTGGRTHATYKGRGTFLYNIGGVLSVGPDLNVPRYGHSCGLVKLGQDGGQAAIVTGGLPPSGESWKNILSTEVLLIPDIKELEWSSGPDFPNAASFKSSAVSAPDGTLVVTGGSDKDASTSYIFQLDCTEGPTVQDCVWHKLKSELKASLTAHMTFLVPKDFAVCGDLSSQTSADPAKNEGDEPTDNGYMLIVTGGRIVASQWIGKTVDTEIYHISQDGKMKQCDAAEHYLSTWRELPVGGLLYGQPFVCGGGVSTTDKNYFVANNDCQKLGSRKDNIVMSEKRSSPASILITRQNGAEQKLWITGGANENLPFGKYLKTTEYVSTNKRFSGSGVVLPKRLKSHCMSHYNQSTVLIIGGRSDFGATQASLFMNIDKDELTEGPELIKTRYGHECGLLSMGESKRVVMAGGFKGGSLTSDIEILMPHPDGSHNWMTGPNIPVSLGLGFGAGVATPEGSFLMVAGVKRRSDFSTSVFQLACSTSSLSTCRWTKLEGELFVGRKYHVAIMVPSTYLPCN